MSCWFAVWDGWADLRFRDAPRFSIPGRTLLLFHGATGDALTSLSNRASYRSPNLWWPEDKAWCVATEIDFSWTYIGASVDCIAELLADPQFEALPTTADEGNKMEDEHQRLAW